MTRGKENYVLIRGGGDLASGVARSLYGAGFLLVIAEIEAPTFIRRAVCYGNAIYEGEVEIEGIRARKIQTDLEEIQKLHREGIIPVIIDENLSILEKWKPFVLVDAILAKKNIGTTIDMAKIVVALGPGFEASKDVHIVVETKRGHNLGRIIYEGEAEKNTGIPGTIGGFSSERVIHSPYDGEIYNSKEIGDFVKKGDCIAKIGTKEIYVQISGVLRGIIKNGFYCKKGLKIADIDPRLEEINNCFSISDKSRAIGNAVLLSILEFERKIRGR